MEYTEQQHHEWVDRRMRLEKLQSERAVIYTEIEQMEIENPDLANDDPVRVAKREQVDRLSVDIKAIRDESPRTVSR